MPDSPDLREQLAAYLAGDLDDAASERLEARMADEPWVARAADDLADLLTRLADPLAVDPPAGLSDRLRAGIAAEIGHPLPSPVEQDASDGERSVGPDPGTLELDGGELERSGAAAATGWSTPPRRDASRPGRGSARPGRTRTRWLTAAAAVAVLFIGSTALLQIDGTDDSSSDTAEEVTTRQAADDGQEALALQDEALEEEGAMDATAEMDAAASAPVEGEALPAEAGADGAADESAIQALPEDGAAAGAGGEETAPAAADAPADDAGGPVEETGPAPVTPEGGDGDDAAADSAAPVVGPEVVQLQDVGTEADEIRQAVATRPAVEGLVGQDAGDVREVGRAYTDEIIRSPAFDDGTSPGACLQVIRRDAGPDAIPAVAALLQDGSSTRLAYALVRSTDGEVLDQVDVWVTDPADCTVLTVVS